MGQPLKSSEMSLKPQIVIEPFEKWALEFVGPINPSSQQKSYILCHKMVKVKELTRAIEKLVSDFMFQVIFVHFRIPKEIVIDGGPQFTSNLIKKLVEKYGIHHKVTSPYHPQANGKVESINKVIE